jgi:cyanophycinase
MSIPKGKLLVIGGAEDKEGTQDLEIIGKNRNFKPLEILKELIPEHDQKNKTIEIVTTASSQPVEVERMYREAFKNVGFDKISFMDMGNNTDANNPELVKRVQKAHAVFFSGGDQFRLATILGNTDVLNAVRERYLTDKDFTVAGTSAGAMAAAKLMIYFGETNEALLGGDVKISSGLGFIDDCIIDTHFIKRGRFGRLSHAIVMNPNCIGIGIGEDTALIIQNGNHAECRGSGMVIIIDGKDIGHTNIAYADEDYPLNIEGLKVHILSNGTKFLLKERQFIPSAEDMQKERSAMRKI